MAVNCPDNSTECLLRALIETTANQTSPWEARSFGVSVAIGVAAFLISFVAIFQGLLAAGPGRIKASSNAIGKFSKLSKGKISWIEFAWRSTAKTPLITFDDLRKGVMKQTDVVPHGKNYPFLGGSASTGATWLHLLRCVGLDEEIETVFDQDMLQPCATDHLPADIQAPPMLIQLHCLAILAAIADPSVQIEKADHFISIRGRISHVLFHEHPVLGTLGTYERYQTRNTAEQIFVRDAGLSHALNATLGRCNSLALDLAYGRLRLTWGHYKTPSNPWEVEFWRSSRDSTECLVYQWHTQLSKVPRDMGRLDHPFAKAIAFMVAQTDYEIRPFPWKNCKLNEVVRCIDGHTKGLFQNSAYFRQFLEPGGCFVESSNYGTRNPEYDTIFEARGSWVVPDEPWCEIDGSFDEDFWKELFADCTTFLKEVASNEEKSDLEVSDTTYLHMEWDNKFWYWLKHVDILLRKKRIEAMDVLDALTAKWVNETADQEVAAKAATTSGLVVSTSSSSSSTSNPEQMTAVPSSSLGSRGGIDANVGPRPSTGSSVTEVLGPQEAANVSQVQSSQETPKVTEEAYLQTLLFIRAILFAALLRSGPDTSILFQPDFKNSTVKMI